MVEIVFFDIDGTLIDENKKTSSRTIEALKELKDYGIKVVLCTGRSKIHFQDIRELFEINSYICFNGAYGVYNDEIIFKKQMELKNIEKLMIDVNEKEHKIVFSNDTDSYANDKDDEQIKTSFNSLHIESPTYHPTIWRDEFMYQGYLYCTPEEEEEYVKNHPEFKFTRWHKFAVDINDYNMNKARGIESFLRHLNIRAEHAVAFGDNLNDLEMLEYVGYGIAMGDGVKEAKEKANFVTKAVDEDGIYYGLKHLNLIK